MTRHLDEIQTHLRVAALTLNPQLASARLPGGLAVMRTGPGFWTGVFETRPQIETRRRPVMAWLAALTQGEPFYAYDLLKCWPAAHPGGDGIVWQDLVNVSATTATTISLSGCPAGLTLTQGDHVSLVGASGKASLHVCRTAATASGGALSVTVAPPVPPGIVWSQARLKRPGTWFILNDPAQAATDRLGAVAWTGTQRLV